VLDALLPPVHVPGVVPVMPPGVELVPADVRDAKAVRAALDGVDAVIHLAAYQDYMTDFSHFFDVNTTATAQLYELAVRDRLPLKRIVVASSQAVYGEGDVRCEEHGVQKPRPRTLARLSCAEWEVTCPVCDRPAKSVATPERDPGARNSYGLSKWAGERAALALGETYELPTVCMRYSIVHGAGQSPRNAYSGVLRSTALRLRAGLPPVIFEDGAQLRDYVSIDDVVAANLLVLEHPGAVGRSFNVGGGRAMTVLEVARGIGEAVGRPIAPVLPGEFRVGDVRHVHSDCSALESLGWKAKADLPDTWRRYWEWLNSLDLPPDLVEQAHGSMRQAGVVRRAGPSVP